MKPFSAFYDAILPELRGCATAMVDYNLRQVARDFCERTSCWRDAFPASEAQNDTLTYYVVPPEDKTELVRLLSLTVDGALQWSFRAPDPDDPRVPRYPPHKPPFTLDVTGELVTLTDQPQGLIEFTGSMKPALAATQLPDLLLNKHLEAMRTGVLARLKRMGGMPWTDLQLSEFYRTEFEAAVNHAGMAPDRNETRAPLRTRPSRI